MWLCPLQGVPLVRSSPRILWYNIVPTANQYQLEEFSEANLLVYIVHHMLVPTHEVSMPDEKKLLLDK